MPARPYPLRPWLWLGAGLLVAAAPTLWLRWLGIGVLTRGRSYTAQAALTFDGGPDPQLTPALLGALHAAGVRASFFLSPSAAARWPELVAALEAAGHEIGLLAAPPVPSAGEAGRDNEGRGEAPPALRPPPGPLGWALGWGTLWAARRLGLPLALGTVEARQGRHSRDPARRVLRQLRPGGVAMLDGAGSGGAAVARQLPALLGELNARGYTLVPMRELAGLRPDGVRDLPPKLIRLVDVAYDALGRLHRIGEHASSLFRVGDAPYPLAGLTLPDGTHIGRGTRLIEFHLDSARLVQLAERPLSGRQVVRHSLHDLAGAAQRDPRWQSQPAAFSISIFSDVLRLHGFQTVDLPPPMRRRLSWWSRTLRRAYGVSDLSAVHVPKLAVISRRELIRRFGQRRA